MNKRRLTAGILALVLAGCSGSDGEASADETATATTSDRSEESASTTSTEPGQTEPDEPEVDEIDSDEAQSDDEVQPDQAASDSDSESAVAPLEPYNENQPDTDVDTDPTTAWVSRRSMSATMIEVVWSAPEGADQYQLHRIARTSDAEPDASDMTEANRVHTATEQGAYIDTGVTGGTRYWYGIRGLDPDGNVLSFGWHPVAAVTDEEPPQPVEVSAEIDDGSVLLTWSSAVENYEMHGYRILRGVDGAELEVVATTWDTNQTSFLDADPPTGLVTYAIVAFDFHWNDSEPSSVALEPAAG